MSPVLQAAIEERIGEMSSRQSAFAAVEAQRAYEIEAKRRRRPADEEATRNPPA